MEITVTRQQFITKAREWVGTPYHHQARLKHVGCDCIGLIVGVAREFGIEIDHEDFLHYGRSPRGNKLMEHCEKICGQAVQVLLPATIAVFWMNAGTERAQHMGVVTDSTPTTIIHCYNSLGIDRVVEHGLDAVWLKRWICSYNLPFIVD